MRPGEDEGGVDREAEDEGEVLFGEGEGGGEGEDVSAAVCTRDGVIT